MTRVRVVIEYDVKPGTSGQRQKARALAMAKQEYGEQLQFCSYELVKPGESYSNQLATILDTGD